MNYRLILPTLVVLGVFQTPVQANEPDNSQSFVPNTVQKMLTELRKNHPDLKVSAQERGVWQAHQQQVRQWENPTFQLSAEDFVGTSAYTDNLFTQYGLQLEQNVMWPHKRDLIEQEADLRVRLSQWQYTQALTVAFGEVYETLVHCLILRRQRDVLQQRLQTLEQLGQMGRVWLEQGKVSRTWLLPFEQEILRAQRHVQMQDASLKIAEQKLRVWGVPETFLQPVELQVLLNHVERYVKEHRQPVGQQSSEWQVLQAESQIHQSLVAQAEQLRIPDVTVSGGLRYHVDQTWGGLLMMGLKTPLWHQYAGELGVANERLAVNRRAQEALLARTQRLWVQENMRLDDMRLQKENLRAEVMLLEEEYALTYQAFLVGKISQWELLRLSQRVQSAQQEALTFSEKEHMSYGQLFLMIYPFSEQITQGD